MIKSFKEHLDLTNETYIQHFKFATCVGLAMVYGGIQAIIHAIYPGTLTKAADLMMERGAKSVRAICTHPILSGNAYERIENSKLCVGPESMLKKKSLGTRDPMLFGALSRQSLKITIFK